MEWGIIMEQVMFQEQYYKCEACNNTWLAGRWL